MQAVRVGLYGDQLMSDKCRFHVLLLDLRRGNRCSLSNLVGPVGSASVGRHPAVLMASAGPVDSVGLAALEAAGALVSQRPVAVGAADDRPGSGGGMAGRLSLLNSTTTLAPKVAAYSVATGPRIQFGRQPGRAPGLRAANTGSRLGAAGWPVLWRAATTARWQIASGLRAVCPGRGG
jgi:hypothetical protein